jgi:NAD(P)-dependent dehydrogenase (short-subunit alcohol dehydrogenase family)
MNVQFPAPFDAVVIGASGGIGAAVVARLDADPRVRSVLALSRRGTAPEGSANVARGRIDVTSEESIIEAVAGLDAPRLVFVATGILHRDGQGPEKSWRALDREWLEETIRINAIGPTLVAKHLLPKLPRDGKSVFAAISAKVGSISDNRLGGWYGYRASKAALNMMLRSLSIEFARTHKDGVVLALHPGTVDTGLSEPFQRGVPNDKLFTPDYSAERMLSVIDAAGPKDSGTMIGWNGETIAF